MEKILYEDKLEQIEAEMTPFGFIDNGRGDEYEVDVDGTAWQNVNDDDGVGNFFST